MSNYNLALMIYGDIDSGRDARMEEKYKDLAAAFISKEFNVESILYTEASAGKLADDLLKYDAVLVWVNPIEQGKDRKKLDALLAEIANKGCFVSTHPDVILKMGTKDVLYKTKDMGWSGDIKMYECFEDFRDKFPASLQASKTRVIKQHRGNGGNGVFKVIAGPRENEITVVHAKDGSEKKILSMADFYNEFKHFFDNDGLLIDQEWNKNIANGMVRCYLAGTKVAGFGYQEINALYELDNETMIPPGRRYYFTQNCGLFSDLKEAMEKEWVLQLQQVLSIDKTMMPVIWDADFFINKPNSGNPAEKYELCEINVSCVSPFPPSAIGFIVDEVTSRIENKK
jgi:hypothetical protein